MSSIEQPLKQGRKIYAPLLFLYTCLANSGVWGRVVGEEEDTGDMMLLLVTMTGADPLPPWCMTMIKTSSPKTSLLHTFGAGFLAKRSLLALNSQRHLRMDEPESSRNENSPACLPSRNAMRRG